MRYPRTPGDAITLTDSESLYRRAYENLGHRLTKRDGVSRRDIEAAEKRLGIAVPHSLLDYFAVAGFEKRFNCCFNRLLPPDEWFVDANRLVFMEENQAVVYWGVSCDGRLDDPPVSQGVNGARIKWYRVNDKCSVFLAVMLHWHGAYGGALPISSTAYAPLSLRKRLRKEWEFVGEVNRMQAFTTSGKCVCHLKWEDGWRIFAGATTKEKMAEIADELSLTWLT
jgi:hypothetical protein